jgi:sulfotransferase family protein
LITEIQRSGGSLLSQLFDGHPELFVHPFEIHIGFPEKWNWPTLDLDGDPLVWFDRLFERKLVRLVAGGYVKPGSNPFAHEEHFPFHFNLERQRDVFLTRVRSERPRRNRDVIDAYFTSFFAAWDDWRPSGREKWVAGFTPRTIMVAQSMAGLARDYPDGRIITIVRDPRSWWVSARRHGPKIYGKLSRALELWSASAAASIGFRTAYPDRVYLSTYERLITDTEAVMREISQFLAIEFDPVSLNPTYLGQPIRANSSHPNEDHGVSLRSLDRSRELAAADRVAIETAAMPLYNRAVELSRA